MSRFILAWLVGLVAVLLCISLFTFLIMHDVPGGPWNPGERVLTDGQIAALKAIAITLLGFTFMGDGLQETLDPQSVTRR